MIREDYINFRNTGNALLLWEYYNEKYTGPKKANISEFMEAMFRFPLKSACFQEVCKEWDPKFNVMVLSDLKTGNILKIY
jgi:hypothetical protein